MRIVSCNLWGGRASLDGGLLPEYLSRLDADVYCLQEVLAAEHDVTRSLRYAPDEAPVRPHLYHEIGRLLPDHRGYFFPTTHGWLHDGRMVEERVQFGIATFVRGTIPLLRQEMRFVFGEFGFNKHSDKPQPRNAHGMRMLDQATGEVTVLVHLHGLWQKGIDKFDTPERKEQAGRVRGLVVSMVEDRDDHVVVCGDLNLRPKSETFDILSDFAPRSLIEEYGITDTRTSLYRSYGKEGVTLYADYALVSQNLSVARFEAPASPEISDHRPLILEY